MYYPCVVCCYVASVKPHFLEWTLAWDSGSLEARSQIDFLICQVDPVTLTGCFRALTIVVAEFVQKIVWKSANICISVTSQQKIWPVRLGVWVISQGSFVEGLEHSLCVCWNVCSSNLLFFCFLFFVFFFISRDPSTPLPAAGSQLASPVLPLSEWLHPGGWDGLG